MRARRWRRGHPASHGCEHITVGTTADGCWYVARTGRDGGRRTYPREDLAYAAVRRMIDDSWEDCPANYNHLGVPEDDGPWVKVGSVWRRPAAAPAEGG